ncbi:MAG: hypothetical protein QS748_10885 [Candidatus Endonucleobacter bathymodioli]|uniref:Uncharacterized protein n=1 Tax=Candidatus Endonucleibacter bathymodioli TaxID=539814 RepID=A0AA90P091_9GAMM|nr:hypothetical protein [Candidatus Endonucleobacter bathymodioli]
MACNLTTVIKRNGLTVSLVGFDHLFGGLTLCFFGIVFNSYGQKGFDTRLMLVARYSSWRSWGLLSSD